MPDVAQSSDGAGGYRVVCDIAKGGMGRVELVVRADGDFVRLYARKRLLDSLTDDVESRTMFRDEARIAGMLRHPNVVGVYDVGEDEEGLYLLMDYVEGVPLTRVIAAAKALGEPIPIQSCLHVLKQVAEGLHAAHELRDLDGKSLDLVHRDVSPSNILVEFNGVVKVADFGIARAAGRRAKTSTGLLKGKMGYIAPELLRFEKPDRRADLYSLGVVLYEMVTAKRLYQGEELSDVAQMILNDPAPDLGADRNDVPDSLVELCFELLAKEPAMRAQTAKAVALRLDETLQELLQMEEPTPLEDYLRLVVDDRNILARRQRAQEIARAILAGEPAEDTGVTTDIVPMGAMRAGRSRRALWLGVAAVALVGVGSALGVAITHRTTSGAPEPLAVSAQPPDSAAPDAGLTPEAVVDEANLLAATDSEADSETDSEAAVTTSAMERLSPRHRRPRMNRMSRMGQMAGSDRAPGMAATDNDIEPWGWE